MSEAANGYEAFFEGENWLSNQIVLPLRSQASQQSSEWRGRDAQGREFIIRNDNVLGVSRQSLNPEGEFLHGQRQEEARKTGPEEVRRDFFTRSLGVSERFEAADPAKRTVREKSPGLRGSV